MTAIGLAQEFSDLMELLYDIIMLGMCIYMFHIFDTCIYV